MPFAIRAIETFGRANAFSYNHLLADLAKTEKTIRWAIGQLSRDAEESNKDRIYLSNLSKLLCKADPRLLISRADEVVGAPQFLTELTFEFQERLRLIDWDADRCWKELED